MTEDEPYMHRRSNERLRYAVDVCHKAVNDAFKIFSIGKRPYHQLFSDVCQDINAQLDTLNLLIQPLLEAAPKYDFEGIEANGIRSILGVVDCILKELIAHLKYCIEKHSSLFFNGTNCAAKLSRFCALLSRLGKLLDIATLMHQHLGGKSMFLEVNNPVGALCMREFEGLSRECFYGQLVGLHYLPSIRNVMKGICVALSSYGMGYYTEVPTLLAFGQPQSLIWRSSVGVLSSAKYWFKEEDRSRKFVELTHNCATIDFTKSFWNLVDNGPLAEVPKMVNRNIDIAVEIFIEGEPLYVRNRHGQMILIHPPVGKQGFAGVTVGFLSARYREGQVAPPVSDPSQLPPARFPKSKRLLVHFHGGGFVSGSHVQHEAYLRGWCRELDAVVVSINYSLAPENPFPKGLDDCVFAYAWCLENLHTLGCTGKSIVFMGDSAGGNLAMSTAMRANSYGLRAPDGILAAYPVTYVKYAVSVSRLLSTLDILLPSGVLQCCLRAYSGVPVDSNYSFFEWLQTADQIPAGDTPEAQTISELNSRYISDICGSVQVPKYNIPATPDMPSIDTPESEDHVTPNPENRSDHLSNASPENTAAQSNGDHEHKESDKVEEIVRQNSVETDKDLEKESDEPAELDTIRFNPVVFDNTSHFPSKEEELVANNATVSAEDASPDVDKVDVSHEHSESDYGVVDNVCCQDENPAEIPTNENTETSESAEQKTNEVDEKEEEIKEANLTEAEEAEQKDEQDNSGNDEESLDNHGTQDDKPSERENSGFDNDNEKDHEVDVLEEGCTVVDDKAVDPTDIEVNLEEVPDSTEESVEVSRESVEASNEPAEVTKESAEVTKEPAELIEGSKEDGISLSSTASQEHASTNNVKQKPDDKVKQKPDDDDLERMLYEDNETRFKGAKLVLTPSHKESEVTPVTPVTPATPTKTYKVATVVRDDEQFSESVYPEPAYVINPGEIATRKNATLLQKYFDDPFMSPYLADDETLAALPPIHVVAAEYDPLLDDSVAFCRRMKEAGGSVSLEIVPGMTHGFLNLVLSSSACAVAAKRCLVTVSSMFTKSEEEQVLCNESESE